MIESKNITVKLNDAVIINDVSFKIEKGGCIGIIGPNGSGKTTLLRSLLGQLKLSSGDILIEGHPMSRFSLNQLAQKVAWVSSELHCMFNYSVLDIVKMGRFPYHRGFFDSLSVDDAVLEKLLELTELSHLKHKPFNQLSSGEKQRVQLAKALAQEPSILLLDEPISHLDLKHQENFLNIVRRKNRDEDLTILMVSHHIEAIAKVCSRVIFLKEGRLVKEGLTSLVLSDSNIKGLFGL
ncbi:ABC transporter [Candidatus Marinamargulisbacteria bacterium SCGC AAA071-K20]|nr:ABC transporter [Candidatus Marinamargulisbacteria bacterium SCGC AAA071-K20]